MSAEGRPPGSRIRRFFDTIRGRRSNLNQAENNNNNNNNNSSNPAETSPLPCLPCLPSQRPRPLTPTAPSKNLVVALGTLATLPAELRRLVLVAAFGERTLHLDLRLSRPRRADCFDLLTRYAKNEHGLGSAPLGECAFPDHAAPPAWRWYGCVCHRLIPLSTYVHPHLDECLRGRANCEDWLWECRIGVMGWLLACRQAYAEGIDVLYSTNTFFLESTALFNVLFCPTPRRTTQQLLLPQRLASITSLELRWELLLWGQITHQRGNLWTSDPLTTPLFADKGRAQLAAYLCYLGEAFPNLQTLVLAFTDSLYHDVQVRPVWALEEIDRLLLRPIADAIARLQHLQQQVVVELPSNVFDDLNGAWTLKGSPSLGLEVEKRGVQWPSAPGKTDWLRYPLSGATVYSAGVEGGPVEATAGGRADQGRFYYIKKALESELTWDLGGRTGQYYENPRYGCGFVM